MAYTNSPLVAYTKLSPNHSGQRTHSIDRITPHCVVGAAFCREHLRLFHQHRPSGQLQLRYRYGRQGLSLRGGKEPLLVFLQQGE